MNYLFLSCLLFWFHIGVAQSIVYVSPTGSGDGSGTSWANALPGTLLASRLSTAAPGTQFWLISGTYKPTTTTDRTASFSITSGVSLYGGFQGGEATLKERNLSINSTTLSGNIGNPSTDQDNSYHVVVCVNSRYIARLDNLIIEDGNSTDSNEFPQYGAGVLNYAITDTSRLEINSCQIRHNKSMYGGGLANYTEYSGFGQLLVSYYKFNYNESVKGGSALFNFSAVYSEANAIVTNSWFTNNICLTHTPFFINSGGTVLIISNGKTNFSANSTHFTANKAFRGGCINVRETNGELATISVDKCLFKDNHAENQGGVFYNSIYSNGHFNLNVTNSLFISNTAQEGALAYFDLSDMYTESIDNRFTLTNCTLFNNTSPDNNILLGGLRSVGNLFNAGSLRIKNSIITSAQHQDINLFEKGTPLQINYSIVAGGYDGINVVDKDPNFINYKEGDFRVSAKSPAINSGDPNSTDLPETDFTGQSRVLNGQVDMGAYESVCDISACTPFTIRRTQ